MAAGGATGLKPRKPTMAGHSSGGGGKSGQLSIIQDAAQKAGIPASILYGVWGTESGFAGSGGVRSSAGAIGPFQFMPGTAASFGIDPTDFKQSAYAAAKYLAQYKDRGLSGMLSAYNAGPAGGIQSGYVSTVRRYASQYPGAPEGGQGQAKSEAGTTFTPTQFGTKDVTTPGFDKPQALFSGLQSKLKQPNLYETFQNLSQAVPDQSVGGRIATDNWTLFGSLFRNSQEKQLADLEKTLASTPDQTVKMPTIEQGSSVNLGTGGGKGGARGGKYGPIMPGREWGGSQGVLNPAIRLYRAMTGNEPSSRKRAEDLGNTGGTSDHLFSNKTAYAADLPASGATGTKLANSLKAYYGIKGPVIGTFQRYNIKAGGRTYSIQILWQVQGHYDHVHIGARLVA